MAAIIRALPPPTPVGTKRQPPGSQSSLPYCLSSGSDDGGSQYFNDSRRDTGNYCAARYDSRGAAKQDSSGTVVHCDIQLPEHSRDSDQSQYSRTPARPSRDHLPFAGRPVATPQQGHCTPPRAHVQSQAQEPSPPGMVDLSRLDARLPPPPGSLRHACQEVAGPSQDVATTPRTDVSYTPRSSVTTAPMSTGAVSGQSVQGHAAAPNHSLGQTTPRAQMDGHAAAPNHSLGQTTPRTQMDLEAAYAGLHAENQQFREYVGRLEHAAEDARGLISLYERRLAAGDQALAENDNLRKQLAAYAVEVDSAREERGKLESSHCQAQEALRQHTVERDDSQARSGELEQQLRELQRAHSELQETLNVQQRRSRDASTERGTLEANLREAQGRGERSMTAARSQGVEPLCESFAALQEGFVAQTREFSGFIAKVKEQRQEVEQQLHAERNEVQGLEQKVTEARTELSCLQEELDNCELQWQQRFEAEAQKARSRAAELLQRQENHQGEIAGLNEQLRIEGSAAAALSQELSRRDHAQHERNVKRRRRLEKDPALARLEKALSRNISLDMYRLHQGLVLEKVHERNSRRESRLVVVSGCEMMLRWGKGLVTLGRRHSCLDLYEVIRIHYGNMARACVVHADVAPWLCFSLYTPRRSFDFCCKSEEAAQSCVLGLSRLCDWASGAVRTHGQFLSLKGWCKLEEFCFRQRMSLGQLFREAAERTAAQLGLLADCSPETAEDARRPGRGWAQRRPEVPQPPETDLFSD